MIIIILTYQHCDNLKLIAKNLNLKWDNVVEDVKEAYLEKLGDAKLMVKNVVDVMKDYAMNTKCEDLLNGQVSI